MATYFTSSNNQRDAAPMVYLPGLYQETSALPGNMMMYINSGSYSDNMAENSQQQQQQQQQQSNCIAIQSIDASNSTKHQQELLVMHSMNGHNLLHGGHSLHSHGLSLSLSTQIPSGMPMSSIQYQNSNSGFDSFFSLNPSIVGDDGGRSSNSQDEQPRNVEYLPSASSVDNHDSNRADLSSYGMTNVCRAIPNSRYLGAAQQLLDEVVNVRNALKQLDRDRNYNSCDRATNSSRESDIGSKYGHMNPHQPIENQPNELSQAEKQELQNKLTKLLSMLDEVDRKYKQYYQQMQIVVTSFDAIAGGGAAKPYTALALQTISRHFRCLRDAITNQILAIRRNLGEQEILENIRGVAITRLRYVDQKLKQPRTLHHHQLGVMQQQQQLQQLQQQQVWRPQRGLPECSVSVLRAWLFEHFLHPYPKDSDKMMLARQTGLTRSQVSNWFINARVRLWKPMVEEMYKEEIGDAELDSNSSSENAAKVTKCDDRAEMQHSASSMANERSNPVQLFDSSSAIDITRGSFPTSPRGEAMGEYHLFSSAMAEAAAAAAAAATAYQLSEVGGCGAGNNVSLTLGLQHCDGTALPISSSTPNCFVSVTGDDMFGGTVSSMASDAADFDCVSPAGGRQHRLGSSHLLHDFVA